ncbi:MAG: hypothetical protein NVS2B14_08330 [Chamaesiphon sp.]
MAQTEFLGKIKSHIDLLRWKDTLWHRAFQLLQWVSFATQLI